MIQVYVDINQIYQTEEEYMLLRTPELNEWTTQAMKNYRAQIKVNGIYDQLHLNPDGTVSNGNARVIIGKELGYTNLPIDMGWLLGMQYFPLTQKITIRTPLIEYFRHPLDQTRKVEQPLSQPIIRDDLPVPGFNDITVFKLDRRIYTE